MKFINHKRVDEHIDETMFEKIQRFLNLYGASIQSLEQPSNPTSKLICICPNKHKYECIIGDFTCNECIEQWNSNSILLKYVMLGPYDQKLLGDINIKFGWVIPYYYR